MTLLLMASLFLSKTQAQEQPCTISTDNSGVLFDTCPLLHQCVNKTCVHKDIFPLTLREIIGAVLVIILSGLSTSGGLGGGSVLTPLLLTFYQYTANKSITLGYVLIFGGSLGNFLNIAFQRDIKTGKPLIIYDLALIMVPLMLLGSSIGVLLNKMLAPVLIISGLVFLLMITLRRIYNKAKVSYANESQAIRSPTIAETNPLKISDTNSEEQTQIPLELEQILQEEKSFLPKSRITFLGCVIAFNLVTIILKGTDKFASVLGIHYCSMGYWLWFMLSLIGCYLFYHKGLNMVKYKLSLKSQNSIQQQDFQITTENLNSIQKLAIITGLLGATLGIGGGIILGNPMLAMGLGAQNMTATCGLFIVITSFVNLVQAFLIGSITQNEVVFFFLISSVGSYLVSLGITWLVKKYKRPSILLFSLSLIMAITLAILPLFTLYKTVANPEQMLHFGSPC